jgi:hypothetical protein
MQVETSLETERPRHRLDLPGYIDSSMLSSWRSCKQKFHNAYLLSLHPTGKSIHLVAGGALAAGVEAARRLVFSRNNNHRPSSADILQAAYQAFAREWGDFSPAEGAAKSFENTFGALTRYLEQYPPETDPVQPLRRPNGEPTVEYTFSIPIEEGPLHPETEEPFVFVGRFDLLGELDGLKCVMDEKTTSQLGAAWDAQWDLRGQFMGYIWACQQQGFQLNTAIIRGIPIMKRSEKPAVQSIKQFPQHLIDRWYRQLLLDLHDIRHSYNYAKANPDRISDVFNYNFADSCNSYGGCAFAPLCLAKHPEDWEVNFVKHRWDPLAKQPVKEVAP